jgi:neurotransmitter:Na+ symporter, NSS family
MQQGLMQQSGEQWGSRIAIVAAAVSMAVGTGNIWRFPRIAAEWGGGAFLFAVTIAVVIWAIPLLMCEFLMGARSRLGNIGAFRDFMGRGYAWAGAFMACVTLAIMGYYSVVTGWCLRYFAAAVGGELGPDIDGQAYWEAFTANPALTAGFHALAVIAATTVVYRGIRGGLERVLEVLLAALLVIILVLAVRAAILPGAAEGLRYLFVPDWPRLGDARLWLEAFTQVAWSTGAGWGLLMVYAVYARDNEDIATNSSIVAVADVLVGMLAAMIVLATLFAIAPTPQFTEAALASGNVGLTFIYVVELLAGMPGSALVTPLFFLALAIAALSSLIAMFELGTTNLINLGLARHAAAITVGLIALAIGLPSALWLVFLDNQDWVWGVALLVSGVLTAAAILKFGVERARTEINRTSDLPVGRWWSVCVGLIPVVFVVLFGWWMHQAITSLPGRWWSPLETFSVGTIAVQWLLVLAVVFGLNRFLAERIARGPMSRPPVLVPSRDGGTDGR